MTGTAADLLVFLLDGAVYAVEAALVRTTVWLPALSPAPDAPPGIVGRFNLRGEVVPVFDLALRLGHGLHRRRAGDQVMVLDLDGATLGIMVSRLRDLVRPTPHQFLPRPGYGEAPADGLLAGTLQLGEDLVILLDARRLPAATLPPGAAPAEPGDREPAPETETLFQTRAQTLRQVAVSEERSATALAVVDLAGQYFGLDLAAVREFCQLPQLFPLPCCPPHVAGVFNLRGQLVTVLEISSAFDIPPPTAPRPKAVIGELDGRAVAVAVDEVIDVFNPRIGELRPLPAAATPQPGAEIRAVTSFAGRRVSVVDLAALLKLNRWVVDETVP
ncbi:MAG TPA: chemotaxis protein CheW [Rhodocyclaceae bacterium]|nr:chemotaxis protein CheW [Rhodocyclaceae bacterium]